MEGGSFSPEAPSNPNTLAKIQPISKLLSSSLPHPQTMGLPLFPPTLGRRPDIRFDRCMGPRLGS